MRNMKKVGLLVFFHHKEKRKNIRKMNDASNSVTEMPFLSGSEGNIHTNLGKDRHHQGKQI